MLRLLFVVPFVLTCLTATAGPREDAFQVVEQFKKAFESADVTGVVSLFAPDAVLLGTVSPKLTTTTEGINEYFQVIKQLTPRTVVFGEYVAKVLSDDAVLFAGLDTFTVTRDSNIIETPARFTMLITKTGQGWRISHFHSSVRPKAP